MQTKRFTMGYERSMDFDMLGSCSQLQKSRRDHLCV